MLIISGVPESGIYAICSNCEIVNAPNAQFSFTCKSKQPIYLDHKQLLFHLFIFLTTNCYYFNCERIHSYDAKWKWKFPGKWNMAWPLNFNYCLKMREGPMRKIAYPCRFVLHSAFIEWALNIQKMTGFMEEFKGTKCCKTKLCELTWSKIQIAQAIS